MYLIFDKDLPKEIKPDSGKYIWRNGGDQITWFGPIEKVNIFVGANNSGKSRFLRGLIKISEPKFVLNTKEDEFHSLPPKLEGILNDIINNLPLRDIYHEYVAFNTNEHNRVNFLNDSHKYIYEHEKISGTAELTQIYFEKVKVDITNALINSNDNSFYSTLEHYFRIIDVIGFIINGISSGNLVGNSQFDYTGIKFIDARR